LSGTHITHLYADSSLPAKGPPPDGVSPQLAVAEASYLDKAARDLSHRLARLEQFLMALPWKSEASISESGGSSLALERQNGEWALCWNEINVGAGLAALAALMFNVSAAQKAQIPPITKKVLLRDASVEVKARACELLGGLIEKVQQQAQQRAQTLQRALGALDELEKKLLNASIAKGGK
jgi:hypothetical protein